MGGAVNRREVLLPRSRREVVCSASSPTTPIRPSSLRWKPSCRPTTSCRRENRALHGYRNLAFYDSDDEHVLCYGKRSADGVNTVLVAVNLDPFAPHEARVRLPLEDLGIGLDESFQAHELITETRHLWKGPTQRIRLDPAVEPAAIFRLERFGQRAYGTPCY